MRVYGVDFTSAPCRKKPITVAIADASDESLRIRDVEGLEDFAAFENLLHRPGPWIGGFDFPFGVSREAVNDLGWPAGWSDLVKYCASLGRREFARILDAYRESRPKGKRYATRLGDTASGAHPSVKLVRPPVGFMFLEGAPRLALSGLHIPGLVQGDETRVALEAYPGFLIRRQLKFRDSYKNDSRAKQMPAHKAVRGRILDELLAGQPLGTSLRIESALRSRVLADGSGDLLDALICAAQAHWGWIRRDSNFGLPVDLDAVEGWIVTAPRYFFGAGSSL